MKLWLVLLAMPVTCDGGNEFYFTVREAPGGIYPHRVATLNGDEPFYIVGIRHKTDWTRK